MKIVAFIRYDCSANHQFDTGTTNTLQVSASYHMWEFRGSALSSGTVTNERGECCRRGSLTVREGLN